MKPIRTFLCRAALLLPALLMTGCQFWDMRTWGKPKQTARNVRYEAASPYATQRQAPPGRVIAVSGMGYQSSMDFRGPGPIVVAESQPVSEAEWSGDPLAGLDSEGRRERFGRSLNASSWGTRDGVGGAGAREEEPPVDAFAGLPYAIKVPGKPGFVNLPAPHSGLPQIDVRGIASGTPVEVPNPLSPGERIQFRVP